MTEGSEEPRREGDGGTVEAPADERAQEREQETPPGPGRGHPIGRMLGVGLIASLVGVGAVLLLDWFPVQGSTKAGEVDRLYDITMVVAVPIFVLVMTVAIYSAVKFRARPGDMRDGAPIHGNARLEVVWVAIPFLIVSALAAYSWIVLDDIEARQPNEMVVNVRGQQFAWSFAYPPQSSGGKPVTSSELVLPVERPVEFRVDALDVIHSFWVPAFRLKTDAVPGITTKLRITPHRLGRYDVVCAELCGLGHSTMRQTARVVSQQEYDRFIARAASTGPGAPGEGEQGVEGGTGG